jgi:hypothetical protein
MKVPRLRRRWVVLVILVLVALGAFRLLDQPVALESYRVVDLQTLDVVGYVSHTAWTHVTGVTETDATVTITVNSFVFNPFPTTAEALRIEVPVHLSAPLGIRAVIDGSTGLPISAARQTVRESPPVREYHG